MAFRNIALATAAVSLAAAPAVAEASLERANAPIEGEALGGENEGAGIIIAILAAAAILAGIIIAADGDDDDGVSP